MAEENYLEEITSELAFIGAKLEDITKCLRKLSNWTPEDEEKYSDKEEEDN